MKLRLFVLFLAFITSGSIFSQSFYVKLHSGYGVGTSTQNVYDYKRVETSQTAYSIDQKSKSYSYGSGIYFGGNFGYFISSSVGIDLELQYLSGSGVSYRYDYTFANGNMENDNIENHGNAFMISPSVLLKTELSVLKPYLKLGPVISFASITNKINADIYDSNTKTKAFIDRDVLNNGGIAIGLNASLGIAYEILQNTEIFVELNSKNISYSPTKGEVTKFNYNGADQLNRISISLKQTNYEESMHYSTSGNDSNQPYTQIKTDYPFSSLTFSLGFSYGF